MRRLPPQKVEKNLSGLLELVPDLTEDLLSAIDQPLKVRICTQTGKEYLICDYNRDGDSYRSPWSSTYDPPVEEGLQPSPTTRQLEVAMNEAFGTYREMYYEGGISSAYVWDTETGDKDFAACILIKKYADESSKKIASGSWDSIHVIECHDEGKSATYKITSTVMLHLSTDRANTGVIQLSGNLTRQVEYEYPKDPPNEDIAAHVANVGRSVEDMEFKLRNSLQEVYFGKTKDIVNDLRSIQSLAEKGKQEEVQRELATKLQQK